MSDVIYFIVFRISVNEYLIQAYPALASQLVPRHRRKSKNDASLYTLILVQDDHDLKKCNLTSICRRVFILGSLERGENSDNDDIIYNTVG